MSTGSWGVVEAAMASGMDSSDIYVEVLAPTLHEIGESWKNGGVQIEQEHLATGVATALIGRLGPRFVRPGRKKGAVISPCRRVSATVWGSRCWPTS